MIVSLLVGIVVCLADLWTKGIVTDRFLPGESRIVIPHILYWTYVRNEHGAFGLFGSSPTLLIAMAFVVLGMFWYTFRDLATQSRIVRLAFGAIAGGALGNIIDRIRHGYVVDFIDVRWWPVFNLADSCITIGVIALIVTTFLRERDGSHTRSASS